MLPTVAISQPEPVLSGRYISRCAQSAMMNMMMISSLHTRGRKSSVPIGGREGPTGYDVSPIAIYVSKGRLCARLPYCPHRGWVSYESQPSRGNMARYRGIPYQDGSRGLPGRISPQVIPFRYSGYRPCFLDHFQISGDPTRSGGTGPRSPPLNPYRL